MAKNFVRDDVPLSRFGVLVAQLESIVASASHKSPDALLCFDLLSDLISAIAEESKDSILLCQRKCEDALYSLLVLGARKPVRHLASEAMARVIQKGDSISIYSRASSLQGFLSDGKKSEPQRIAGAAECLGELYRYFGRRITSGLLETTTIVTKLLKFNEDFVREEALQMLQNALEGSGGGAAASAYTDAFRIIMRTGVVDKSSIVRVAAARCLKALASIGGPGLGVGELDNACSSCVKALEDPISSIRDAFAEALGALLGLGLNPDAQVQPRGKSHFTPKKLDGGLERHLTFPFVKASGPRAKVLRVGLTLSWVSFLQAIRLKYLHPDTELEKYIFLVMDMLRADSSFDAQALACILYILRVGITDQMSEPTQRGLLVILGKQLQSPDATPSMRVAALRTMSYALKTLGEVPAEFKDVLDNTVVSAVSHHAPLVRVEAALTLRALTEVDPTCIGGLISYAITMLGAVRDNISFEKGANLKYELECLDGQAAVLAALVSISPSLPLGYPSRLPRSVLELSKKMIMESSRNPMAAAVEKEAGWMLLSSLLACMPKEELEDQVFDILSLWASAFQGSPERHISETKDLQSNISVWSAAVDALTAFIKSFVSAGAVNKGILLEPVLLYLSRALSYILLLAAKDQMTVKQASDIFIIKTLIAYQSISDPTIYRRDHARLIQICGTPYREASKCEESSCLRMLLDKRDAWLGPWNPGRDLFEDELRSFQGGKDGLVPCVWANELPSFPKPETISKMLVNQKLLCFGNIFASEDVGGMLSLLEMVEQCLRAGKKQAWHGTSVTNICVGLLSGLKALLALRPEPLPLEVLGLAQSIFQNILAEGDICASQRRASSEGLGLLARLGNDVFTARLTRVLLADINSAVDSYYAGSVALSLGCIHRSAGGIALSSLVPATVNSFPSLAKSSNTGLQIWSLHGLLLTVEAAGLSYVSHVQATLSLAMDILLSNEIGSTNLQQAVGRLINAIVAVLGPELSPGSIFFTRCKSVIAEVSSRQETATLYENVRFTQQLVLFAPQAVTVHHNVQTLLPTLSSRQPTLRRLALSTLRHLIEKDPGSIMNEHIEDTLFHMLDEETDAEIGSLARTTVMRLLYASCPSQPSQWLSICRNMILSSSSRVISTSDSSQNDSSSGLDGNTRLNTGDDDENMVSSSQNRNFQGYGNNHSIVYPPRDKHLRYRTRVFAAECLSHLPAAVGKNPVHFDIALARQQPASGSSSGDWLVLQLQELVSLAYQISTIQFENMRPVGVTLLSTIIDKFGTLDPELPGHLLLEQYQAQLVSAVRTALDSSSGPVLLEAGLQLATKILTCKIVSRDQLAVKRIFSLISRPLNEFNDLYYPSFAEWVSCKIKVRLLTAHASLKCYTFAFLKNQQKEITDEYLALLPLFSESSKILGIYWLCLLKDYSYIRTQSFPKENWKPFLDGIQSTLVSTKLMACLEEAWPLIVQAVALDAVPLNTYIKGSSETEEQSITDLISGYNMVELGSEEFQFLWGFALLLLFQGQDSVLDESRLHIGSVNTILSGRCVSDEVKSIALELCEVALPVFQVLLAERFFSAGFLTMDSCQEVLQVCFFSIFVEDTWDNFAISILSQIAQKCPLDFLKTESFVYLVSELYLALLFKSFSSATSQYHLSWDDTVSALLTTAPTLLKQYEPKMGLKSILAFLLVGYKCIERASTEISLSRVHDFVQCLTSVMKTYVTDISELGNDSIGYLMTITRTCLTTSVILAENCTKGIHQLENKRSNLHKLLLLKLALSLEQTTSFAKLAFEIQLLKENQGCKPVFYAMICNATRCFRSALTDPDIQVQAIGLQILKGVLTRKINSESYSFFIFFVGELVEDLGSVIQKLFKTPMSREVVAIAGECLKVSMLLQTLSRTNECQKCLMNLFLEAVLLFTTSENSSQEARDLKITAIKLVTQLAQLPDSSACIKEVLLTMPMIRRQQLQDIIRASVMQDQNQKQVNSTGPSFIIKLPAKIEENRKEEIIVSAPCSEEVEDNSEEEEEDDWDTFQSFPSTDEVDHTKTEFQDSRSIENTISDGGFKGESISVPQDEVEETTDTISDGGLKGETISIPEDEVGEITAKNQMASDDETLSGNADSSNQTQDLNGSKDGFCDDKLSDAHHMEKDRAVLRHSDVILPDSQSEVGEGPETCENLQVQKRTGGNLSSEVGEHAEDVKAHGSFYEDHQRSREESSETNKGTLPNLQPSEIQSMPLDDRNEDMKEQTTLDDHHEDEEMRDTTSIKDHQEGKDLKDTTSLEDHHEEKDLKDTTSLEDHHEEKDLKDTTSLKNHHEERKTDEEDQCSNIDLSEQSPKKLEQTTLDDHHEDKDMRDITSVKDQHAEKDMKDPASPKDYHEERKTENEDLCSDTDLSERLPKDFEQTTLDHHKERNAENKDQRCNIELAKQSPKNLEGDEDEK
ncbi:protein SWEETIE isoform X1 [Solanum lycopersicum]|uniref:protein SWEETIE isoform X1 n=3 Tax=Solanum lycopersicum TaxID=4081 RepID=UPI0002BCA8E0|nr:protein SWEETIE isoform X1 [Solanum lycopersicum]